MFQQLTNDWKVKYLPLAPLKPVPADIVIARSQQPKSISDLANEIGLMPYEVIVYLLHHIAMSY